MRSRKFINERCKGLSLIEVMISTFLFAVFATAFISGILFARNKAQDNIWRTSATTVAVGFLEQIRAADFDDLAEYCQVNGGTVVYELIDTIAADGTDDPLCSNSWPVDDGDGTQSAFEAKVAYNTKSIDINDTPTNTNDDLQIEFFPKMELIDNDGAPRIVIDFNYRWKHPDKKTSWTQGIYHVIVADVENENDAPNRFSDVTFN